MFVGCMDKSSNFNTCEQDKCATDQLKKLHGGYRYCCCTNAMCNLNISIVNSTANDTVTPARVPHFGLEELWQSPMVLFLLALSVVLAFISLLVFLFAPPYKPEPESAPLGMIAPCRQISK